MVAASNLGAVRVRADSRLVLAGGRRRGATDNKPKIAYVHPDTRAAGSMWTCGL